MGCHFLFQGIFLTQGSNPCLLHLLHWQADFFTTEPPGKPSTKAYWLFNGCLFFFFFFRTLCLLPHLPPLHPLPPFPLPSNSSPFPLLSLFSLSFFFSRFYIYPLTFLFLFQYRFKKFPLPSLNSLSLKCCLSKVASLSLMWTLFTSFL